MKSYSTFEERLIAASSENALKQAKQLLKTERLTHACRDESGMLHGAFEDKTRVVHTRVRPGEPPTAQCECALANASGDRLCEHALALLMYTGRFKTPTEVPALNEEAASYIGLKNAGLTALGAECPEHPAAELLLRAESAFPHVPSKWENAVLSVRLNNGKREYLGNLNNLRHLFFDKSLAVTLKLGDFSLQDQQIIRFLAINAEPDGSNLLLNSEQTSELFHCLGGFERFTRNNRRLIVHTDSNAEAVVLRHPAAPGAAHGDEFVPGIEYRGALLEIRSAKVITGRSGCWVGRDGEYFWLPAGCDISFLRNFFRLGSWRGDAPGAAEFMKRIPLAQRTVGDSGEPEIRPGAILLSAARRAETLQLQFALIYDAQSFPPDGGRLQPGRDGRFWRRNELLELKLTNDLAMLGVAGTFHDGKFALNAPEQIGMFLDRVVPLWCRTVPELALGSELAKLAAGGNGLAGIELFCTFEPAAEGENYRLSYRWGSGAGALSWKELNQLARRGARYAALDDGTYAAFSAEAADAVLKLNGIIQRPDEKLRTFELPRVMLNYYEFLTRRWPAALPDALRGFLIRAEASCGDDTIAPELHATLRKYQLEGVEWLRRMLANGFNVILADEMGLGKTIQALAAVARLRRRSAAPALVIAPASLVENWQREAAKFLPDYRVGAFSGATRETILNDIGAYDLLISSYALARRDATELAKQLFSFIILDEAQHIKNPGTANAHCCKSLRAQYKLVLTGTPLENSPDDLWSIFDFLHPGLLGSFTGFKKSYNDIAVNPAAAADLAARVGPFIKRRNKSEVAPELPPKIEHTYFCTMDEAQRALYDELREHGRRQLAASHPGKGHNNFEVLTTLLRLRQVCCHPALLGPEYASIESAKFELFKELVEEHIDSGHKMLLFSQFTSLLGLLEPWLKAENIRYCYLDGATRHRQQEVDRFNDTPEIPIFLLSLKAGGTGLNLTAADTVIIYDPWWNPAVELQAADRTHRIGQTRPVSSLKLLVKDSIEENILKLKKQKQEIFDNVVDNPALIADKFTLDELKFLLQ